MKDQLLEQCSAWYIARSLRASRIHQNGVLVRLATAVVQTHGVVSGAYLKNREEKQLLQVSVILSVSST